jgi:hypothetical protein
MIAMAIAMPSYADSCLVEGATTGRATTADTKTDSSGKFATDAFVR